ncbi:hypothetical protein QCA50_001123 [Cerrena zonata]|uniref:Uncharacterized protein n=1 Tax=Cerrena zonata TaxID=2478898 RepID=A0AAW0H0S4_9APHY
MAGIARGKSTRRAIVNSQSCKVFYLMDAVGAEVLYLPILMLLLFNYPSIIYIISLPVTKTRINITRSLSMFSWCPADCAFEDHSHLVTTFGVRERAQWIYCSQLTIAPDAVFSI